MLKISTLHRTSADLPAVERLYMSAFPEVERHTLDELFDACDTGRAEWLVFKDSEQFVGLAFMVIHEDIAYILYLAVEDKLRNQGYGAQMLREITERYPGKKQYLLMESLHEKCDNMPIRIRRKGFYLRNGFQETGYIQSTCEGAAIFDILSTVAGFDTEKWQDFIDHYPMEAYMDEYYRAD